MMSVLLHFCPYALQVGDDTFGRSTLHNFKDNLVNTGTFGLMVVVVVKLDDSSVWST